MHSIHCTNSLYTNTAPCMCSHSWISEQQTSELKFQCVQTTTQWYFMIISLFAGDGFATFFALRGMKEMGTSACKHMRGYD